MAITHQNNSAPAARSMPFGQMLQGAAPATTEAKPAAKVWLNVGYEVAGKFINLPLGLPIDTMGEAKVQGQNEDWVKQRNAQNQLLKMLQDLGMSFEPGQEQTINLQVRLRKVNEDKIVAKEDNEYSIDMSSLLVAAE